jgi:hypothetical protein
MISKLEFNFIKNKTEGKTRLKLLDQRIYTQHLGLVFDHHHFLHPLFDKNILRLVDGGIISYWDLNLRVRYNYDWKPPDSEPVILTLDHLSVGFLVWVIALVISSVGFLGEIVFYWSPKMCSLICFESMLRVFFKN